MGVCEQSQLKLVALTSTRYLMIEEVLISRYEISMNANLRF